MLLKCEIMLLKCEIIETKVEYFNTLSKHFVGYKNPFFTNCVDLTV